MEHTYNIFETHVCPVSPVFFKLLYWLSTMLNSDVPIHSNQQLLGFFSMRVYHDTSELLLHHLSVKCPRQFHISPVLDVKFFGVSMDLLLPTFCNCFPRFMISEFHLVFLFLDTQMGVSGLSMIVLEHRLR
jgi:hypothetical protein